MGLGLVGTPKLCYCMRPPTHTYTHTHTYPPTLVVNLLLSRSYSRRGFYILMLEQYFAIGPLCFLDGELW